MFAALYTKRPMERLWSSAVFLFLGLLDPHPDPQFVCMDPAPDLDPSINKQKMKKNLHFFCFMTSL
jgi:hypothetical protein